MNIPSGWLEILVLAVVCLSVVVIVPRFQTRRIDPAVEDRRFCARNEARRTTIQIVAGIAILSGIYTTYWTIKTGEDQLALGEEQLKISQAGQKTERLAKATEELGSGALAARLGGILAFEQLSVDLPRVNNSAHQSDFGSIMTLVSAWVRATAPWKGPKSRMPEVMPADIEAALSMLGRRDLGMDDADETYDLSGSDLRGADMAGAEMDHLDLTGCHLEKADFKKSTFARSDLSGAHLEGAHLNGADLSQASDLEGAHLEGANLQGAKITPDQLAAAMGDTSTKLPDGVTAPSSWKRTSGAAGRRQEKRILISSAQAKSHQKALF